MLSSGKKLPRVIALAFLCCGIWVVISTPSYGAPTLWGYTGLINIPTADIVPDGRAIVGMGYVYRPYGYFDHPSYDNATYYVSVGFLPFLELHMRVTRFAGRSLDYKYPGYGSDKDRSMCVRLRLLEERGWMPAVLVGVHDPAPSSVGVDAGSNGLFYALYMACSKTVAYIPGYPVRVHAGYATDRFAPDFPDHPHFAGLFGGVELAIADWLAVMAEHDTHKVSAGLRWGIPLFDGVRLGVDTVLLDLEKVSGGACLEFGL